MPRRRIRSLCWPVLIALAAIAPLVWAGLPFGAGLLGAPEQPLTVRSVVGGWAWLVGAAWFGLAQRGRDVRPWEPLLVGVGGALALTRLGHVWLYGLLLAPALTRQLRLASTRVAAPALPTPSRLLSSAERPATGGDGRFPRLRDVWVLLVLAMPLAVGATVPLEPQDIWWTVASGGWMVAHQALLTVDPFTSGPLAPGTIDAQWLAQLAYYGLYRLGGPELLIAASAALASAAYACVLGASLAAGGRPRLACAAVVAAFLLGATNLSPRPQTLALPLFGLFVLAMARARTRPASRLLWVLPLAAAVWANVHGSFVLGLLLLGCEAAGAAGSAAGGLRARLRCARPYLLTLVACGVGVCLTPDGPNSLRYVYSIASNPTIRDLVTEWAPTSVAQPEGVLLFLSVAGLVGLALRSPARLGLADWLALAAFGWLALSSMRGVVWWGMLVAPVAARLAGPLVDQMSAAAMARSRERWALNVGLGMAILLLAGLSLPWFKAVDPFLPPAKRGLLSEGTPVDAAAFLAAHTSADGGGKLFNHQAWGGYLDWVFWAGAGAGAGVGVGEKPFVDGRFELYPAQTWQDYLTIAQAGPGWQAALDAYGFDHLLLDPTEEAPLVSAVEADPAWTRAYQDGVAVVFVRQSAATNVQGAAG